MIIRDESASCNRSAIVMKECLKLSNALLKYSDMKNQLGVTVILGGGSEIFSDQMESNIGDAFNYLSSNGSRASGDPILYSLYQLRLSIKKSGSFDDIEPLKIVGPILKIIRTSSIPGTVTAMAIDSVQKLFELGIVCPRDSSDEAIIKCYKEIVIALTHCRFEETKGISGDAVLLKVVSFLKRLIECPYSSYLTDSVFYEMLQIIMSLVCNKKRSEVLRKAAEAVMVNTTLKVFEKLHEFEDHEDGNHIYINDQVYAQDELKKDTIGANTEGGVSQKSIQENAEDEKSCESSMSLETKLPDITEKVMLKDELESLESVDSSVEVASDGNSYGIKVVKDYLNLLLSLIVPEKQEAHSLNATIFALNLLNIAVEAAGRSFLRHPRLFTFISDPIFKSLFYLIQNSSELAVLQSSLELFTTIVVILGDQLTTQIELTFNCLFNLITIDDQKNKVDQRSSLVKALIIEQLSVLWACSPSFFTATFLDYDCHLDRSDVMLKLVNLLITLSTPETAARISKNIPSICLEGLISFIDDMNTKILAFNNKKSLDHLNKPMLLEQRKQKTAFIECSEIFNQKPVKGLPKLIEKGFIRSDSSKDIAEFLFENNSRMNKKTIGLLLCDPEKSDLLKEFIDLYDFDSLRVDEALRILLIKFRLPGESQQIERIIESFAHKYVKDQNYENKIVDSNDAESIQPDADSVFVLSYSIIMLNTDLHNPQVKEHMSFEDYSNNLRGCNNSHDFPPWYLKKIYASIRDKEIIMPEEHHGDGKWFQDAWDNLISSTTVVTETNLHSGSTICELSNSDLCQFDKEIFRILGGSIIETFCDVYLHTNDKHVSLLTIKSLEQCAYLASFFQFSELFNKTLNLLSQSTTLFGIDFIKDNQELASIETDKLVRIFVESTNVTISVSKTSLRLGKYPKGQACFALLFKLIRTNKQNIVISEEAWKNVIAITLTLLENCMISPDVFTDLQHTLKIGKLPTVKPKSVINKVKINKGLLSAFASYLKGDDEPTDDEIEIALKASECVQQSNVLSSIFSTKLYSTPNFIKLFLNEISSKKTIEDLSKFETRNLFLVETCVALYLFCKNENELGIDILLKIVELSNIEKLSKETIRRLAAYKILMFSILGDHENLFIKSLNDDILTKNEVFTKNFLKSDQGLDLTAKIIDLSNIHTFREVAFENEGFWKFLRNSVIEAIHTKNIYDLIDNVIKNDFKLINSQNFNWIVGLLDELSSVGALSDVWESNNQDNGNDKNPHQDILSISLQSITLTVDFLMKLLNSNRYNEKNILSLIQSLSHQCMNPSEKIRIYALDSLAKSLVDDVNSQKLSETMIDEIVQNALLPLLENENGEALEMVPLQKVADMITTVFKKYDITGENRSKLHEKFVTLSEKHKDTALKDEEDSAS